MDGSLWVEGPPPSPTTPHLKEVMLYHRHAVETAGSGEEAMSTFRQQDFDIMLMEVRMLRMGGVESFREA